MSRNLPQPVTIATTHPDHALGVATLGLHTSHGLAGDFERQMIDADAAKAESLKRLMADLAFDSTEALMTMAGIPATSLDGLLAKTFAIIYCGERLLVPEADAQERIGDALIASVLDDLTTILHHRQNGAGR